MNLESGHAAPLAIQSLFHPPTLSTLRSPTYGDVLRSDVLKLLNPASPWKSIANLPEYMVLPVLNVIQAELDRVSDVLAQPDAACLVNYGQEKAHQTKCIKCMRSLVRKYGVLPTSFFCRDVRKEGIGPIWGGGFADIWKGNMSRGPVCLKVLRLFTAGSARQDLLKVFCQEALVWRQLRHPNVLPFLGISQDLFHPSYCLISPWMENGNILAFLSASSHHGDEFRLQSLIEISAGIEYLHNLEPPVVHADIQGGNILITDTLHCVLADFGISLVVETQVPGSTTMSRGSTRWLPPEVMDQSPFDPSYITARDVYSFGCTIIEIYTGQPPFPHLRSDAAVIKEVLLQRSGHPRPPVKSFPSDCLWELVVECLSSEPSDRPTASTLLQSLMLLVEPSEQVSSEYDSSDKVDVISSDYDDSSQRINSSLQQPRGRNRNAVGTRRRRPAYVMCSQCLTDFTTRSALNSHIDSVHLGAVFCCTLEGCGKQYTTQSSLRRHCRLKH